MEANIRTILLVDDSREDAESFHRALQQLGSPIEFHFVLSADEATSYLQGEGQYADRRDYPVPALLVLNPKMPLKDGWELLGWVRERPEFSRLVVIMLGGNGSPGEKDLAYRLGANACHPKPPSPEELERLVELICGFWIPSGDPVR